ncbi:MULTISPECIES: hypothetical protein [unclassified Meiothermus]|uniref:hypothetical protein n=1 Tax=unclassified Meiothermus TaxID=370471 RepID=UPI000D7D0D18|nr:MULTISPECIES: hypothetical protein [unclassified Meiothermus]PZA08880.1 hypothetical protein DNA98_02270 [Meiothermus sp. Pnk-1]RYM33747.1 hypothetical protein EWH23_12780 [Meiothermus sp. PNK-Is4]
MKHTLTRWILASVAAVGISSSALAANALDPARLKFGVDLALSPAFGAGIVAGASYNYLANLATGVNLGARASLDLAFAGTAVGQLSAAPVATFDITNGGIFVGPSIGIGFGGGAASFGFGVLGGIEYNVSPELMLYGQTSLNIAPGFAGNLVAGADFEISSPVSVFGEARVVFGGTTSAFGLAAGINYRL